MNTKFKYSSFIYNEKTKKIMYQTILACFPGMISNFYFFGNGLFIQLILAYITAIISESIILKFRKQPIISKISDGSAILTAQLLTINLSSITPWWMTILATSCAIIFAKQLYGGLGKNILNPAMVGYVILIFFFPIQLPIWLCQQNILPNSFTFIESTKYIFGKDILDKDKQKLKDNFIKKNKIIKKTKSFNSNKNYLHNDNDFIKKTIPVFKYNNKYKINIGCFWNNFFFLLGGIILIKLRIISWIIPLSLLISMMCCAIIGNYLIPKISVNPLVHLFSKSTMLGAFFIATDPVTSSTSKNGHIIFGTLIGILIWIIRTLCNYPDSLAFAVLLANICVPLINRYT